MSRIAFQTAVRGGAVTLLEGYRSASGAKLNQIYRARPAQIKTPSAFVDTIAEDTTAFTTPESQRVVRVGIRLVWGVYDSGPTVDQRDTFIEGFYAYFMDTSPTHPFGGNTDQSWIGTADDEQWSPSWLPADESVYFSTLITLEGSAST